MSDPKLLALIHQVRVLQRARDTQGATVSRKAQCSAHEFVLDAELEDRGFTFAATAPEQPSLPLACDPEAITLAPAKTPPVQEQFVGRGGRNGSLPIGG